MTRQKTVLVAAAIVALLALAAGSAWYLNREAPAPQEAAQAPASPEITLTIEGLYTQKTVPIEQGQTLLAVLTALNAEDPSLALELTDYPGLGTLVERLGIHRNGESGNYWHYKVNGVLPLIGAADYTLQGGEAVEWYFGASQQ